MTDSSNSKNPARILHGEHEPGDGLIKAKQEAVESFLGFLRGRATPDYPLEVHLDISNACNQRCVMCPRFSTLLNDRFEPRRRFLPPVRDYINELTRTALKVQISGWGEPTAHPEFDQFLESLADNRVLIEFFTNGSTLEQWTPAIVGSGVHRVTVSLSGTTAREYESVYAGGNFEHLIKGIERLASARAGAVNRYPLIEVNSLSFRHHMANLDRFVEMLAGLGVDRIAVTPLHEHIEMFPSLEGHAAADGWEVSNPVIERAFRAAENAEITLDIHPNLAMYRPASPHPPAPPLHTLAEAVSPHAARVNRHYQEPAESVEVKSPHRQVRNRLGIKRVDTTTVCHEPFKTMYIAGDGQVKACCFMQDDAPALGSVETNRPLEVWRGSGFTAVRRGILRSEYPMRLCGNCLAQHQAPANHGVVQLVDAYRRWALSVLGDSADEGWDEIAARLERS
jgi:pyruvate-formate lyase-activating enzyme